MASQNEMIGRLMMEKEQMNESHLRTLNLLADLKEGKRSLDEIVVDRIETTTGNIQISWKIVPLPPIQVIIEKPLVEKIPVNGDGN